jgi:uncharacterized protein (TIGR00369 family)
VSGHFRGLEALYAAAPINQLFSSRLHVVEPGRTRIEFEITPQLFHGAGAAHGTVYFKMLDDAAFYAANSLVEEMFVLTTAFNIFLTRPVHEGPLVAEGRWVSGRRRVLIAESWLTDRDGEEVGRGTGTFMRSRIELRGLPAYAAASRA